MSLDVLTMGVVGLLIASMTSAGLFFLLWLLRGQLGLKEWVTGLWLNTLGSALIMFRGAIPLGLSVLAGNGAHLLACGVVWIGACRYCRQPVSWGPVLAPTLIVLAVCGYFTFVVPSVSVRIVVFSVAMVGFDLSTALVFARHGQDQRASTVFAAGIFFAQAAFYAYRIFITPPDPASQELTSLTSVMVPTMIAAIVGGMMWTLTFIFLVVQRLITELAAAARVDGLTGALNRRTLEIEGPRVLHFCRRQKLPCAVLMIDLDHFKQVNDRHGHAAGDDVLRRFAKLAQAELRSEDLFARYGGEEFCLVLPGSSLVGAHKVAERLRYMVEQSTKLCIEEWIRLSISIGVAAGAGSMLDLHSLVKRADAGLYRAKAGGRNRVSCVTNLDDVSFNNDLAPLLESHGA